MEMTILCTNCSAELDDEINDPTLDDCPCPYCGATTRDIEISVSDTALLLDQVETTIREKGIKNWSKRQVNGEEYFRLRNEVHSVIRVMNWKKRHEAESYYEFITNTNTGEIVKDVTERFIDHGGHGSAKRAIPDFSHKWIAVAAYHIWEKEGRMPGRHINNWNRAKNELKKLWKAGLIQL